MATKWVSIVFMQGDDYNEAVDAINDMGGSVDAAAEYLSRWDYGTETDDAHTTDGPEWGPHDTLHTVTYGGLEYVYAVNHIVGYMSLNRHPLT